jgi:hypothetical protein
MKFYRFVHITLNKIVFLVLSKFTKDFPPISSYNYSININNNDLNLSEFSLGTFDVNDFKDFLFFNHSEVIYDSHFFYVIPSHLSIFDSEGKLFGHYIVYIYRDKKELYSDESILDLMDHLFKICVYDTMKKNVSAYNYKFYMHISNKKIF